MLWIARAPNDIDPYVAIVDPSRRPQPLTKRGDAGARIRATFDPHQHADEAHALGLLRVRRERPSRRRATEQSNELATFH